MTLIFCLFVFSFFGANQGTSWDICHIKFICFGGQCCWWTSCSACFLFWYFFRHYMITFVWLSCNLNQVCALYLLLVFVPYRYIEILQNKEEPDNLQAANDLNSMMMRATLDVNAVPMWLNLIDLCYVRFFHAFSGVVSLWYKVPWGLWKRFSGRKTPKIWAPREGLRFWSVFGLT